MTSLSDHLCLQQFAAGTPEAQQAFATLVERHAGLVYSVALRYTRSPDFAAEVSQSVFRDLAKNARQISPRTPIVAWLHLVSRRTAIDLVRREHRRRAREQAAFELAAMHPPQSPWTEIEPLLDDAVGSLPELDRTAILLRYFENKSLREVGAALGTSDDAAQKRVSRALDHLRAFFLRRGVTVATGTIAMNLSTHAVQIVPGSVLGALSSASAVASLSSQVIFMTTLQKSLLQAAAVIAVGGSVYQAAALHRTSTTRDSLHAQIAALQAKSDEMRTQRAALERARTAPTARGGAMPPGAPRINDPELEAEIRAWFGRVAELQALAAARPDLTIPEMRLLTPEDWFAMGDDFDPARPPDTEKLLGRLRARAKNHFGNKLQAALNRYIAEHQGMLPGDTDALRAYLSPEDEDMLGRYAIVQRGRLENLEARDRRVLISERPSDNETTFLGVSASGFTMGPYPLREHAHRATRAYAAAHHNSNPPDRASLLPYFSPPLSPKLQAKFLDSPPGVETR